MTAADVADRDRLERRLRALHEDMRVLEWRCARECGFVVGSSDQLRMQSLSDEIDELEDRLADLEYLDAFEDTDDWDEH